MSKILKITTLLLMITFGKISFSQPYQKMLGETNEWNVYYGFIGAGETHVWTTTFDTIINSNVYKAVRDYNTYGWMGLIKEDTLLKKTYYRNCDPFNLLLDCDTTDFLLYDFGKSIGDTVVVYDAYLYQQTSLILDSITIDTILSANRIFNLHRIGSLSSIKWIEGVGSMTGLENNLNAPGEHSHDGILYYLLCAYKDSSQTFQISSSFFPFPPTCSLFVEVENIEGQNKLAVLIFPNPVEESLNVSLSNKFAIQNISLMTLSGKILIQTIQPKISVSHLSEGLYFVRVEFTNGQQVVRKIVIQ